MPESFLRDKNVPARWRVLGLVNGFIINGGCFYGSNEWVMEQLGCSEQTVSNAFAELEELGEIRTERTKRTRKVYKTSRDPSQLGSETQVGSTRDPSSFGTNSVSNSEKNTSELEDEIRVDVVPVFVGEDDQERTKKPAKYPHALEVFSWMPDREKSWEALRNVQEREYAEYLYDRGEKKVKSIIAFCLKYGDLPYFPAWRSPSKLEKNWQGIQDFAKRNEL